MKVFVFEYVTGGGLAGSPLPPALTHEADLIVRALVRDLLDCPGVRVLCGRDPRLPPVPGADPLLPTGAEDPGALFARGVAWADAVWPTAPETGDVLARLAETVLRSGKILLGCRPAGIRTAASKHATSQALARAGVPVVPTFGPGDSVAPHPGRWVVKPDDGAGCEGVRLVADSREAGAIIAAAVSGWVAQPWVEGEPASLSLLCTEAGTRLLSANRQVMSVADDRPRLTRLVVNALPDGDLRLATLGQAVTRAIPGLWGYVGVDLVLTDAGPVVLEVNPRLTTSCCGIRPALGLNVAELVLALLDDPSPHWRQPAQPAVTHDVALGVAADG